MNASDFIQNADRLKGDNIEPGGIIRTIGDVDQVQFPDEKLPKLKVLFRDDEREMILNRTQTKTMIELFGDETDSWINMAIMMLPVDSGYQGKKTIVIARPPTAAAVPQSTNLQEPQYVPVDEDVEPVF